MLALIIYILYIIINNYFFFFFFFFFLFVNFKKFNTKTSLLYKNFIYTKESFKVIFFKIILIYNNVNNIYYKLK